MVHMRYLPLSALAKIDKETEIKRKDFYCRTFFHIFIAKYNIYLYEPHKRRADRKRHQTDLACRETRQEFQRSQFLCLQPPPAEFGGTV